MEAERKRKRRQEKGKHMEEEKEKEKEKEKQEKQEKKKIKGDGEGEEGGRAPASGEASPMRHRAPSPWSSERAQRWSTVAQEGTMSALSAWASVHRAR